MNELNITGIWWDAEKPDEKVAGTLIFDPVKGGRLKLVGTFGGMKGLTGNYDADIIHGLADNKLVTLCKAYTTSLSVKFPGPNSLTLITRRVLVGAHLLLADLVFDRIDIGFEYLPEFTNSSSLVTHFGHEDNDKWTGLSAEVKSREKLEIGPVREGKASIRFGWSSDSDSFRSVTIFEQYSLCMEFPEAKSLDELLDDYARPAQDLVTMATDRPNAITKIEVRNKSYKDEAERIVTIELFQRSISAASRKPNDSLMRHDMLFTLSELENGRLEKWLEVHERFGPAVGILFGQRYSKDNYLENKLLNAVSAAEAYHRRRFTNTILDKPIWKSKRKEILNDVRDVHKGFVQDALAFANEKRLKDRLDEILAHSGLTADLLVDSAAWNKEIRGYRNTLTHYDPDSPTKIENYERLHWLAESLAWIMLACLMVEMGFDAGQVLKLFSTNERYKFARSRIKQQPLSSPIVVEQTE